MSTFHSLQIQDIKQETAYSVSIAFTIPDSLKNNYAFVAGQYLTLKAIINNKEIRRSYSICSSTNSNEIRVAVKQIENGLFSTYANSVLKAGNNIEVSEPEGKFCLNTNSSNTKNYMAIAAGSGITPIMSMIKTVLTNEPDSDFVLLYGNKTPDDTIFYSEINELKEHEPNRFFVYYTFSQSNIENSLFGRIDTSKVNYVTKNKHQDVNFDAYYLCGPEEMINLTSDTLKDNGVPSDKIFFELFTTSSTEKEIVNTGETKATIILDDEETEITIKENETLLDATLRNGLDAPYSCQGGVCSSCICLLEEGKAEMRKNSVLTDAEIDEGLVLACQAVSTTAKLVVNFDDV